MYLFRQIASALLQCHELGIVHRDVKPENIFISDWNLDSAGRRLPHLKLGDFGSSILLGPGQTVRQLAGTLNYMSPEILRGERYSSEVDIWSLGVIFYIMLCGVFPFYGETKEELAECIKRSPIDFSSKLWSFTSPEALHLLCWMLERDPKRRARAEDVLNHPFVKFCSGASSFVRNRSCHELTGEEEIPTALPVVQLSL